MSSKKSLKDRVTAGQKHRVVSGPKSIVKKAKTAARRLFASGEIEPAKPVEKETKPFETIHVMTTKGLTPAEYRMWLLGVEPYPALFGIGDLVRFKSRTEIEAERPKNPNTASATLTNGDMRPEPNRYGVIIGMGIEHRHQFEWVYHVITSRQQRPGGLDEQVDQRAHQSELVLVMRSTGQPA